MVIEKNNKFCLQFSEYNFIGNEYLLSKEIKKQWRKGSSHDNKKHLPKKKFNYVSLK